MVTMKNQSPKRFAFKVGKMYGNVVLHFGHSPETEFGLYGGAFHEAAQLLVEKLSLRRGYSDLDACPIVFLYRHSLELYCKAIVLAGNNLMSVSGKKLPIQNNAIWCHRIGTLLPAIEKIFKEVKWKWEKGLGGFNNFQQLRVFINEIESIDPDSYAFRYPIKKTGIASIPKHFCFNVIDYAEKMDKLLDLLDGAATGLEVMFNDYCAS